MSRRRPCCRASLWRDGLGKDPAPLLPPPMRFRYSTETRAVKGCPSPSGATGPTFSAGQLPAGCACRADSCRAACHTGTWRLYQRKRRGIVGWIVGRDIINIISAYFPRNYASFGRTRAPPTPIPANRGGSPTCWASDTSTTRPDRPLINPTQSPSQQAPRKRSVKGVLLTSG